MHWEESKFKQSVLTLVSTVSSIGSSAPFWTSKKLILITETKKEIVWNFRSSCFFVENKLLAAFPNTVLKLLFPYTCASWFPTALESDLCLSCLDLRIVFEV